MPSVNVDGQGNLAIGYATSSSTSEPSIRYAGRLAGDPVNSLAQGEAVMQAGGGHQTSTTGRWGDYSSTFVDPADNCTFWHTNEYYSATSSGSWNTRIGLFKFPGCSGVITPTPTATATATATPSATPTGSPTCTPSFVTYPGTGVGAIPDGGTGGGNPPVYGAPLVINFNVSGVTGGITDMSTDITLTHTFVGDVDMVLAAPGGSPSLVTVGHIGITASPGFGDSSNYGGTYRFTDSAAGANIWTVATDVGCDSSCIVAPGDYRTTARGGTGQTNPAPITSLLATFGGLSPAQINGTWTLTIRDGAPSDTGTVTAANLTLNTGAACSTPTATPTNTPTSTPTNTPTSTPTGMPSPSPSCSPANIINDGGFESGGIPSIIWNDPQTSSNFLTPLCDNATCGNGGGASPPRTGLVWAWFGGIPAVETATLGQSVMIPAGTAELRFWMRVGTVSDPFTDVLNVKIDNVSVQSYPEPSVAESAYTERVINLNAFANGAVHNITFEYIGPTMGTASYVIDDVSLVATGICAITEPHGHAGDHG